MSDQHLTFSIIVPVYDRPREIEELLESLTKQTNKNFEVVIVEDGSKITSELSVKKYNDQLNIQYFYKTNSGPGVTRNYGFEKAKGNYAIFLDSDCILPLHYFDTVQNFLKNTFVDAFGGPDMAHESFTNLQKAINYSMTSFFTTGGIRGGSETIEKFDPRSFNMGFSREVFEKTGGFPSIRFARNKAAGEDLDLSIQIRKMGFKTALIKNAYVYHKRRANIKQFYNQVFNFGYARITIYKRHPESLQYAHFFPAVFTICLAGLLSLSLTISHFFLSPIVLYASLLFFESSAKNGSLIIGLLSIITSYIQFLGYGLGFIISAIEQIILKRQILV